MPTEKINYTDPLRVGTDKINKAIEDVNTFQKQIDDIDVEVGEDAVGNENLKKKAVKPVNTTFFTQTKNLFNGEYDNVKLSGGADYLFASKPDASAPERTGIIPINSGTTYTVTVFDEELSDALRIAGSSNLPSEEDYNANGQYLLDTFVTAQGSTGLKTHTFTSSATDNFLFVLVSTEGKAPRLQVEEGGASSEYSDPYYFDSKYIKGIGNLEDANVSDVKNKAFETVKERLDDSEEEFADFADFKITNLIKNGDFNKGVNEWVNLMGVTVEDSKAKISIASGISLQQPVNLVVGHKYYVSLLHQAVAVERGIHLTLRNASTLINPALLSLPSGSTGESKHSIIFDVSATATSIGFSREGTSTTGHHTVDNVILIDLTEAFGAGNEPKTLGVIEDLVNIYNGYFNDTKTLGNKGFSNYLLNRTQDIQVDSHKSIYEELRGNIYQRDFRVEKLFKRSDATVAIGDATLTDVTSTEYLKNNTSALKMTVNSPVNIRLDFPLAKPINLYRRTFGLNFYLPTESGLTPRTAKFNMLAVYLTTPGGEYIIYPEQGARRYPGWNVITGSPFASNSSSTATEEDLKTVTKIRISLNANPAVTEPYDIYFDSLTSWDEIRTPTVRLEFDDALTSVYQNAFPLMAERGMRGATHVITKSVANPEPLVYALPNQLMRMHDVGWDICSHTVNHPYLSEITLEEAKFELEQSQKDLLNMGVRNGAQFFISPYGDNTIEVVEHAKKFYANYRMTGYRHAGTGVMPEDPYGMDAINAGSRGLDGVISLIDKAVEFGGHLPLMWHGEIGETWGGIRWETGEYKDMLDYLIEQNVKVVTYSDQFPGTQIR